MKALIILISFILEGVFSNYVQTSSYFIPLFTLTSLVIIYPLFTESKDYYKYAFLTGLAYDLIYTDTIVFHAIIFCFMAYIISRFNLVLTDNFINILIIVGLSIAIYRIITYLILILVSRLSFDFINLIFSILKSLILNLIYSLILFLIVKKSQKKYKYKFWDFFLVK